MGRVPKRKRKLVLIPRPRSCYNFLCTPQLEEVTMKRQRGKKGGRILLHHCCAFAACLRAASFVSSFFQAPEGTGTLLFCSATLTEVVTWAAPQRTCSHEPKFGGEPGGERQEGQVNSQSTVLLSHCQGLSEILPSAPHFYWVAAPSFHSSLYLQALHLLGCHCHCHSTLKLSLSL